MELLEKITSKKRRQTVTTWLQIERKNFENPSLNIGNVVETNGKRYVILHIIASYVSYSSDITYSVVVQDLSLKTRTISKLVSSTKPSSVYGLR